MKALKIIFVILILAVIVCAILYFFGDKILPENMQELPFIKTEQSTVTETSATSAEPDRTEPPVSSSEENNETAGGNPVNYTEIEITVSEDKYIYNNQEMFYNELIEFLDGLDKNTSVKLNDEFASMKSYQDITSALDERGIPYSKE